MERITRKDALGNIVFPDNENYFKRAYERLAEFEDNLESGRLIELPCKVGDTVYFIPTFLGENGLEYGGIVEVKFCLFNFEEVGYTIFLTKEEAESRLKNLRSGSSMTKEEYELFSGVGFKDGKRITYNLVDYPEYANMGIDWRSIGYIDAQLYVKCGLSKEEIEFIESHVKEMI